MTKLTKNGVSTTLAPGQEQFENYRPRDRALARKYPTRTSYDYRTPEGELFSTDKPTLDECRQARDAWLAKRAGQKEA